MDELTKILFPDEHQKYDETLWATPLGNNLYKLDNSPFFVYGVSWQDVVEAEFSREKSMLVFSKVVEKSGNRTIRIVLEKSANDSQVSKKILDDLIEMGCSYEGANQRYISVNIPPSVNLESVSQVLVQSGQQWENADPTYEMLTGQE
jgi:hypothetical protein